MNGDGAMLLRQTFGTLYYRRPESTVDAGFLAENQYDA